jgi:hypothetical protein
MDWKSKRVLKAGFKAPLVSHRWRVVRVGGEGDGAVESFDGEVGGVW